MAKCGSGFQSTLYREGRLLSAEGRTACSGTPRINCGKRAPRHHPAHSSRPASLRPVLAPPFTPDFGAEPERPRGGGRGTLSNERAGRLLRPAPSRGLDGARSRAPPPWSGRGHCCGSPRLLRRLQPAKGKFRVSKSERLGWGFGRLALASRLLQVHGGSARLPGSLPARPGRASAGLRFPASWWRLGLGLVLSSVCAVAAWRFVMRLRFPVRVPSRSSAFGKPPLRYRVKNPLPALRCGEHVCCLRSLVTAACASGQDQNDTQESAPRP